VTTCLVSVSVNDELGCGGKMKKHAVVEGALKVAEDGIHDGRACEGTPAGLGRC
jgi:hypothetical protein